MPIEWNEVKTWIKDTTKIAIQEAEDLSHKGKIKMEIFSLARKKDKYITSLGNFIYTEYVKTSSIVSNEKVLELIDNIKKTEEKIKQKKEELKKE